MYKRILLKISGEALMGDNGAGLVMKICHNALVAQIQNGVNETMCVAKKFGIGPVEFATAISYGGGQCFYMDTKSKAIADENWTTAFSVENEYKDVNIFKALADECGQKIPGGENVCNVYAKAMEAGYGKEDFCATFKVVRDY